MKPAVSGLEQEYPERVDAENVDAFSEEAKPIIAELGFENHGLVIRDAEGAVLWTQADHTVNMDEVRATVRELLGA